MKTEDLIKYITESCMRIIKEGWYDSSTEPIFSKSDTQRNLGSNPLYTDNGNHSNADNIRQPSTFDVNGASFTGKHYLISNTKMTIYKIQNFGRENIDSSLDFFDGRSKAEKEKNLRKAIDTINGSATRSNKSVCFRSLTAEDNKQKALSSDYNLYTFWEFSYDGQNWNILKPNPAVEMKRSKLVLKEPQTF